MASNVPASGPRWLALESNPESYNAWSAALGLDTTLYSFQEVCGLDPELLSMVPQPVKAVMILFPITESYEKMRLEEDKKMEKDGVEGVSDMIYFKQTIGNACGTFALLHTLANAGLPLEEGPLTELFANCKGKTPLERAALLESSEKLEQVHTATAHTGQTAVPALDAKIELHFASFVEHNGNLIELDGRRQSPVNHGKIKVGLLEDTAEYAKKLIEITQSIEFNLVALSPTQEY